MNRLTEFAAGLHVNYGKEESGVVLRVLAQAMGSALTGMWKRFGEELGSNLFWSC